MIPFVVVTCFMILLALITLMEAGMRERYRLIPIVIIDLGYFAATLALCCAVGPWGGAYAMFCLYEFAWGFAGLVSNIGRERHWASVASCAWMAYIVWALVMVVRL